MVHIATWHWNHLVDHFTLVILFPHRIYGSEGMRGGGVADFLALLPASVVIGDLGALRTACLSEPAPGLLLLP
jgi:hypothetical protein